MRFRPIFLILALIIVIVTTLYLGPHLGLKTSLINSSTRSDTDLSGPGLSAWLKLGFRDLITSKLEVIPLRDVELYIYDYLQYQHSTYDAGNDYERYGLIMGNMTLESYSKDLLYAYKDYIEMEGIKPYILLEVYYRLSVRRYERRNTNRTIPKMIMTTLKNHEDLPMEFSRWTEMMPDWGYWGLTDEAMVLWINENLGGTRAEKVWKELPRQVLKTDVLRYMMMFLHGGLYTDSDTLPVIPAEQWGRPYLDLTPPTITHLSNIMKLQHSDTRNYADIMSMSIEEEPALVISIEADAIEFGWKNWRQVGLRRAVQITQWTFMAQPGHPVFLDAIGRTLRKSEEIAEKFEQAKAHGEVYVAESALDWTGPGVFTDCVYRYLLARYGFKPEQLTHIKQPVRVGDVLILPSGSFSSLNPLDRNLQQRPWAAVWHGFLGRWRADDPGQAEFDRLKKLQDDEEAAALTDRSRMSQ